MHNFSTLVCLTQTPVALMSASKQEEHPASSTLKPGLLPFVTGELHPAVLPVIHCVSVPRKKSLPGLRVRCSCEAGTRWAGIKLGGMRKGSSLIK